MGKKAGFFVGFGTFHCRNEIWERFFFSDNSWQVLRIRLSLDNNLEAPQLNRKLSGSEAWGKYALPFLDYSKDAAIYRDSWNCQAFSSADCLEVFQHFQDSVPQDDEACPQEYKRFLPAARRVAEYLDAVKQYYALPLPERDKDWLAAGAYVLICLFLQNGKSIKSPRFISPPEPYSLDNLRKAITIVVPKGGMHEPEAGIIQIRMIQLWRLLFFWETDERFLSSKCQYQKKQADLSAPDSPGIFCDILGGTSVF